MHLSKLKFSFTKPKSCDVLIMEESASELIAGYFPTYKCQTMQTDMYSLNLFVLFSMLVKDGWSAFKKTNRFKNYVDTYLAYTKPRMLITFIDNNPEFYKIANRNKNSFKTVFIQNGRRFQLADVFESLEQSDDNYVDLMFCFSQPIADLYSRYVSGETFALGSLKSNALPLATNEAASKNSIVWVSGLEPFDPDPNYYKDTTGRSLTWGDIFGLESEALLLVHRWASQTNRELIVAGRNFSGNSHEFAHYTKVLGAEGWTYKPRMDIFSTYQICDSAEIVVTIDGTIGYEALSRGTKVLFLPWRRDQLKSLSSGFGWPAVDSPEGPFWTEKKDAVSVFELLDRLSSYSETYWQSICAEYLPLIMNRDEANKLLISKLEIILSQTKSFRSTENTR